MRFKRPSWISRQIPLITLIAVLLNLCVFTFKYAAAELPGPFGVGFFTWLSKLGGGIALGCLFWIVFILFGLSILWLIADVIMGSRKAGR